jgi:agmatine deiminase
LLRGVDWEFNSWGNTGYTPWDQDNMVARKLLELENIDRYSCALTLEGGSIHTDGQGTLLITEESVINPNRNPLLNKQQIEELLVNYLNIEKIIWLKKGLYLDEAGGHIDGLCCFLGPATVALAWTDDETDPQHNISLAALEILSNSTDAKGRKISVIKVYQPQPCFITAEESASIDRIEGTVSRNTGERLPASYINFYFINNAVLLPTFNDANDQNAINIFSSVFPDRTIIPFDSRDILLGGGNIHCMTQQQPIT